MSKRLYYNPRSAMGDPRRGMGYGKSQDKLPSASTGLGSEFAMGWITGIYSPESEYEDEEDINVPFDDIEDLRSFFKKINYGYASSDSVRPRSDRSSYASSGNRFSTIGMGQLTEQTPIHTKPGISPIPKAIWAPSKLGMAVGGSSSEFGATRIGPGKRGGDGSKKGWSTSPPPFEGWSEDMDSEGDAGEIKLDSLLDILTLSRDERNFLKQQIAVKKALVKAESLIAKEIHTDV